MNDRNYDLELLDNEGRKYVYNFDIDVMHPYLLQTFLPFFKPGNCLELGSSKGDFTSHLVQHFNDITCVEASQKAIDIAKRKIGNKVEYVHGLFEQVSITSKYDNIILTHVLEHIDDPISLIARIKNEWLADDGILFLACPNANAPSRQIAVKMGIIPNNTAVTPSEAEHGHRITYTLDTLERDVKLGGLHPVYRTGVFFKALANYQWDKLLTTDIITKEYLEGCYQLGQHYPDLCSSIVLICKKS